MQSWKKIKSVLDLPQRLVIQFPTLTKYAHIQWLFYNFKSIHDARNMTFSQFCELSKSYKDISLEAWKRKLRQMNPQQRLKYFTLINDYCQFLCNPMTKHPISPLKRFNNDLTIVKVHVHR